jgi:hypothetical protein
MLAQVGQKRSILPRACESGGGCDGEGVDSESDFAIEEDLQENCRQGSCFVSRECGVFQW